jgi:hypothetical protein
LEFLLTRFYKYVAPTALKKDARRQELFGTGHELAPGIVFQCETGQAANQAVQ